MKRIRLSLCLLLLAPGSLLRAADATAPELPPRIKAPTDNAVFRRFVLDNGLKVLLVSDPKFNKSGASLVVNVGQIDDPKEREGLAHFLEHMLFLGTEKYPKVEEYGAFMQANGGYNNAYTASDHTNYQFEVRHEALAEGVDRLAQFFIAPKFSPEYTGREINAVNNEAMRHVQNDGWRLELVRSEVYAKGSGEAKFGIGNKDTLATATPDEVRAFYEKHYTADHMALALAGRASLDDLEKMARTNFSAVPKRDVPAVVREQKFLPRKAALRIVSMEPAREARNLSLEFPIPATRPDFVSKPEELIGDLIGFGGPGGLEQKLKDEGLANNIGGSVRERTGQYGSFLITATLTPEGLKDYPRVLGLIFSYLAHLRAAPFPADFYQERARIAQLNESYRDRGEGSALATQLANQALFYPLEVAERATAVLGAPNEAAYRRLLDVLTPDNMLISLVAKGQTTDREERIFKTPYAYREETGPAYDALLSPAKVADFKLPAPNRFMPGATAVLAERPQPLITEPGLQLYYAPDTEFQRPETTVIVRFVPTRELGTADSAALLALYQASLNEFLDATSTDAAFAGIAVGTEASLEGFKLTVSGYGDSAVRYATYIADNLRTFTIAPARFEARKEAVLRGLRSYSQNEAYTLAVDRRNAITREFSFLPPELLARTTSATWSDVQGFALKFFARGKVEAVVHGHMTADAASVAVRTIAQRIGAQPAPAEVLLRRRHLALQPGEDVLDAGEINGGNSAFLRDYLLPDDTAATRAASVVLSNFIGNPFYTELRTKQQLGYIVQGSAGASLRHRYFSFLIQSSGYAPDELRKRAEACIATLPEALAALTDEQWATLKAGARSQFEEKPKSIRDKAEIFFGRAYTFDGEWERQAESLKALDQLTKEQALAFFQRAIAPDTGERRTILLSSKAHPPTEEIKPVFTDRNAWKASRKYN